MSSMTVSELQSLGYRVVDGKAVKETATAPTDDADTTWQETQSACYRVFKRAGCEVYWLSQNRKTRQTAGLPDLIVFGPPGAPFLLMWETKHGQGKASEAQRRFQAHCQRSGTRYASGSSATARRTLKQLTEELL